MFRFRSWASISGMRTFDPAETDRLLPYSQLADAIADVLRAKKAGLAWAPRRLHMTLPAGGVLLAMPASDAELAITKLATVHPDNPDEGLPTIQGEVVVMDAQTGERLGILDGPALTARRTAAISLLAARVLAPRLADPQAGPGPLLMVGAGVQAWGHLEAFQQGLGVREVYLCSRSGVSAGILADRARELGMTATVIGRPEEVLSEVSLIVTVTTSKEPVLPEDILEKARGDLFVSGVGSFRPDMAELPASLVRRARLYADVADQAMHESGDLIDRVTPDMVTPLEDALDQPRPETGPVVFKCVGHALFDLAAAELATGYIY